jgi:hypothetical protein
MADPNQLSLNLLWPKILQSSVTGILDHEELRANNTMMWNSAIQYLIMWYLNTQHLYHHKLNPYLLKMIKSNSSDHLMEMIKDDVTLRAEAMQALYSHQAIYEAQARICAERSMSHIIMISYGYHALSNLFAQRNIDLIPEHQAILWAGFSNTGKYHEFPVDKAGVKYKPPVLPDDISPEMHETAHLYHRNITGACAAAICAHKLRPDTQSQGISDADEFYDDVCEIAEQIIIDLLRMEQRAQQEMAQLRAMILTANHSDLSWETSFDNTWRGRPNIMSSPLSGVAPGVSHPFQPYNGPLNFSDRVLKEHQWNMLLGRNRIPTYYDEQARACLRLSLHSHTPFNMTPSPIKG